MRITKHKRLWIIGAVIVIIIGIAFGVFAFVNRESALVTNYNECVARGYQILETFPRQCKTPEDIIFTENITSEMTTVKVYFGLKTPTSGIDPCDIVHPISRSVLETPEIARSAIEELLKGPTEEEVARGYFTSLNDGIKLNRIAIVDGEARVDFSNQLEEQVGGSCRVIAIRAQITETLKQFPSVNQVIISINGRVEDILQP